MWWGRYNILLAVVSLVCAGLSAGIREEFSLPLHTSGGDLQQQYPYSAINTDDLGPVEAKSSTLQAVTRFSLPQRHRRAFAESLGVAVTYRPNARSMWNLDAAENLTSRRRAAIPSLRYHRQEGALRYTCSMGNGYDFLAKASYTRSSTRTPLILEDFYSKQATVCGAVGFGTEIVPRMHLAVFGETVRTHSDLSLGEGEGGRIRFDLTAQF